ncbi:MAG: hypothetical protein J0L88_13155 [Xanthomonadales bacterium]|nr:hypothetical protein [Xanthomonadales bacterium]
MKAIATACAVVLALVGGSSAGAVEIVRCTTRDGDVRYQDRPCAGDEAAEAIRLVDDVPHATEPAAGTRVEAVSATSDAEPPSASQIAEAPAPIERMAGAWLCRRDDGSRYLSETGVGARREVPLAMLGVPARGLADAYGRGGAGVSAPGISRPGLDRSPDAALGAAYAWTEDACEPASGDEVCRFLDAEIEGAQKRLRYAFSDTAAAVRAEIATLSDRAKPCH